MRIYWKYRFNTDHLVDLDEAREELPKVKCCQSILFVSEKTSASEALMNVNVLKRFSARVDGMQRYNHMSHFGKLFDVLNAHCQDDSESVAV